ncbi:MAG: VanZ family protein [Clostridia bacterium]|nr:VanZ family protein [Clostridia bacterium]
MAGTYMVRLAIYCLIAFVIYSLCRFLFLKISGKKHFPIAREIATALFISFLFGVLSQTLFPLIRFYPSEIVVFFDSGNTLQFSSQGIEYIQAESIERTFNLIPFRTIWQYLSGSLESYYGASWKHTAVINILGNVLLFVPVGFLLPLTNKRFNRFKNVVLFGFAFSLFIEIIQFFTGRSADIDDCIMNILGAISGYLVLQIPVFSKIKELCQQSSFQKTSDF